MILVRHNPFKEQVDKIFTEMTILLVNKNLDYGDSNAKLRKEFGPLVGVLRLSDKLERLKNLTLNTSSANVNESIEDTLMDIIGYATLELIYRETNNGTTTTPVPRRGCKEVNESDSNGSIQRTEDRKDPNNTHGTPASIYSKSIDSSTSIIDIPVDWRNRKMDYDDWATLHSEGRTNLAVHEWDMLGSLLRRHTWGEIKSTITEVVKEESTRGYNPR